MFFLSLLPLEFTTSNLCLWMTHFRCSHWLFSYIWCPTWQVTSSNCCCPPAPWAWNTALLQLPPWPVPEIMESWNISNWRGLIRIKTETFSTKTTHFHQHNFKVCRKCSSSEHKISEKFASIGMQTSWTHIKQIYPVLIMCRDQTPSWEVTVIWWQPRTTCTATTPEDLPSSICSSSQPQVDGHQQPPLGNTSTTPTDHLYVTWNSDQVLSLL